MANVVTIREAARRAKVEGIPVSEYALRLWLKAGEIPSRKIGQKTLLFYPNLVSYLKGDAEAAPAATVAGQPQRNGDGQLRNPYFRKLR